MVILLRIVVSSDWAQQVAAFNPGMHCLLCPNMEINLHGYFAKNYWFLAVHVV